LSTDEIFIIIQAHSFLSQHNYHSTGIFQNMWNRESWKSMSGQQLLRLVTITSAVAISYEGISQGVMGAVTVAPEFGRRMGYVNENNEVTKPMLQGGIASIYYWYVPVLS
jgi:hypothetical protein